LSGLGLADVVDVGEVLDHLIAPVDRGIVLAGTNGSNSLGALTTPTKQGRLRQREILDVLAEEVPGRCADAVGVLAEERDVQVLQQDLVLGVLLLDVEGAPVRPPSCG